MSILQYPRQNRTGMIILLHIAGWVLFFLLTSLAQPSFEGRKIFSRDFFKIERFHFVVLLLQVVLFYLNAFWLYPRLTAKKHYVWLIFTWVGVFFLFSLIFHWLMQTEWVMAGRNAFMPQNNMPPPNGNMDHMPRHKPFFLFPIFPFINVVALSVSYRVLADSIQKERVAREKENENLKTELSFLRSQISPHFLFNMMNSMVAMARLKSEQLEPSLIKLSGILRYMLYKTDESKVPMSIEIEYLKSYIDLQRLRFDGSIAITQKIQDDGSVDTIEPMLLIPFVENGFKHGSTYIDNPAMDIFLGIKNRLLTFKTCNRYSKDVQEVKDDSSGIGLANVRRRLELLYANCHTIKIDDKNDWFCVTITMRF
jgi:two-component system, LytTR family, sensor kinase